MPPSARSIVPRLNAATLLAATSLLTGCVGCATYRLTRELQAAHQAGTALLVNTDNGGVSVVKASGSDHVAITAKLHSQDKERLEAARVVAEREAGGALRVAVEWPGGLRWNNEGCAFEIALPDATGVTVETSNGVITLEGLSGEARLRSSNGSLSVTDHDGPVFGETSNGTILLKNVSGAANVESSNGPVNIEAAGGPIKAVTSNGRVRIEANPQRPEPIYAKTSNGGVMIRGAGGPVDAITSNAGVELQLSPTCAGPVRVDASNGGVTLELGPAFRGELELDTSLGRIRWNDSGAAKNVRLLAMDKNAARLAIGDGGGKSHASTSNGDISVRFAGQ